MTVAAGPNAYSYVLTFAGTLAYAAQPLVTVNASGLTPATAPAIAETVRGGYALSNEVQTVAFPAVPTAGTWSITYSGQTAAGLAFNVTANALQAALEGLSTIGAGNVKVWLGANAYTYLVAFQGALAGVDAALLTTNTSTLTPATAPTVTETTHGAAAVYPANLTKAGWTASRLVLNPASDSTYQGTTTITAGIMNIRQPKALGYANITNTATGVSVASGGTRWKSRAG